MFVKKTEHHLSGIRKINSRDRTKRNN